MSAKQRAKVVWKKLFTHPDCLFDVHLLNGKTLRNVTLQMWEDLKLGNKWDFAEKGEENNWGSYKHWKDYPKERVIIKIVFHCSSCEMRSCKGYEKESGVRTED